jgi:hypothetical protein
MNQTHVGRVVGALFFFVVAVLFLGVFPHLSNARNIHSYSDTISDSKPGQYANHTLEFIPQTAIAPSGSFEIVPPAGFEIINAPTFAERNVEMRVNGIVRSASSVLSATVDRVEIAPGAPGLIRYTLNPTMGIAAGSVVEIKIGNHTSFSQSYNVSYSSTTGTTTVQDDVEPIKNSPDIGTKKIRMEIFGGAEEAFAEFSIAVVDGVSTGGVDTTEEVPPYRFNGAPSGDVGGTTLNVELSLETDELADCRYSTASSTAYLSMTNIFDTTGQIVHSTIVPVTQNAVNKFYVRCRDDEGNYNIDDYVITFVSLPPPSGDPNSEGDVEGDGTGTGNSGTGGGAGSGGSNGGTNGGGGGSGATSGGGGGDVGPKNDSGSGGGFENVNGPYPSGDAEVVIRGYAFPGSTVYALVDGYQTATVRAGNDGSYSVKIEKIARGVYTFGVYAVDSEKVKSSTFSTSFTVTGGRTSNLSNINIMPSIKVSPNPVNPGQSLSISGYALPNAEISIENQNGKSNASKKTFTTTSGSNGSWSLTIDTTGFGAGTYKIRAKAEQKSGDLLKTNFSDYTFYGVGQSADVPLSPDLNRDGKVNLTDFSILLFWWGGNGGDSDPPADINRDGKVNLTDFSILLFNWTG